MGCAEPEAIDVRIGSRDAERVRVLASIDAVCRDFTCTVLVYDLSLRGARIELQYARFQTGDVVRLRLPFLAAEQPGEVAWTHGATAGIRFFQPLDGSTFRILAKAMQPPDAKGLDGFRVVTET